MSQKGPNKYLTVPNFITVLRIIGSAVLLFIEPLTSLFFIIYTFSGLSDVLDGFIARRTGTTSPIGARLDSIADLLYYAVMVLKIMPVLIDILPLWLWGMTGVVILLRLAAYITAAVKYKKFASMHTYMNKLTGAAMFSMPYVLALPCAVTLCAVICSIAFLSSFEELLMHLIRKEYKEGIKSIFEINK